MSELPDPSVAQKKNRTRTALFAAATAIFMVAASFAAVPLYELFCQVTGFAGTTQVAQKAPTRVLDRTIEVRFDANHAPDLAVEFKPEQNSTRVRLGETGLAFYTFKNLSDRPITAMASYNVTPHTTGQYFVKMKCFCFEEQTFQPGETAELPVVFFVAPELADDRDTRDLATITLSYTFFEAKDPKFKTASISPP
jgi:cytochrome c oxidase assembly protein subunit 11